MEFRLRPLPAGQVDASMNPADYVEGKKVMLPLPTFYSNRTGQRQASHLHFGKKPDAITDGLPWTIATDGGEGFNADIDRISACAHQELRRDLASDQQRRRLVASRPHPLRGRPDHRPQRRDAAALGEIRPQGHVSPRVGDQFVQQRGHSDPCA